MNNSAPSQTFDEAVRLQSLIGSKIDVMEAD